MLQAMRRRIEDDKGFTLIELMVVVLIIAILLAVAIPTFLRVRRNAQDRAAQNTVSAALKAEKAHYTSSATINEYIPATADLDGSGTSDLVEIEASIFYEGATPASAGCTLAGTGPNDGAKCVRVEVSQTNLTNDTVRLVALSQSGTYWVIRDVAAGPGAGTFYGSGPNAGAAATASQW
jgi:type IV pilus assembly protein PilA